MPMDEIINILEKPITVLNYYKEVSLLIPIGVSCTWKCEGCINKKHDSEYARLTPPLKDIMTLYKENVMAKAVVLAGLEPLDNLCDLKAFIRSFREQFDDPIVIYTGYDLDDIWASCELTEVFKEVLLKDRNMVIKFGRYMKDRPRKWNDALELYLESDNQWVLRICK